ncbi:type II secretion system protein [Hydrogenimonas sp.]
MVRSGFSFIELLVSIVIIGIVFMSVPLMLTESGRSYAFSVQQEGIMAGVTGLVNILGYQWDEAETNQTLNGGFAKVCDVTDGAAELNRTISTFGILTNRRIGHFKGEYRRKFFDYTYYSTTPSPGITFATPPSELGAETDDGGTEDDIDDFNGLSYVITGGGIHDYKYHYELNTSVYYISDTFNYANASLLSDINISNINKMTNIKMVKVAVTSQEGSINLFAFSSNIGEYKILHRTYK